jgi:hypothetical protein
MIVKKKNNNSNISSDSSRRHQKSKTLTRSESVTLSVRYGLDLHVLFLYPFVINFYFVNF